MNGVGASEHRVVLTWGPPTHWMLPLQSLTTTKIAPARAHSLCTQPSAL